MGNSILYLASEEGCVPFCHRVGITQVAIFFAFFGPKFNYQSWKLGQIFLCLNSGMFLCVVHELCEVGRCRTSFQGAQDHCVKESVNILINILINICKY